MKDGDESTLQTYLQAFGKLKERKTLKEVLEREMLLAFIQANVDRIAEFPLLETEQNGIIKLVGQRAFDHPCQEYLKGWLGDFLISLNHYAKAKAAGDEKASEEQKAELFKSEKILIQGIQGLVYAVGLVKDNSSNAIVSILGVSVLEPLQEITKSVEPDESFWRALLEQFIIQLVERAYEELLEQKKFSLSKDENLLILRFKMQDILEQIGATPVDVELTRIQDAFEKALATDKGRELYNCVRAFLASTLQTDLGKLMPDYELDHATQIVCMDEIAANYCSKKEEKTEPTPVEEADPREARAFLESQVQAMAVGALMASSIMKQDFLRALKEFDSREVKLLSETLHNLERSYMKPALSMLYESYFIHYLRKQAGEDAHRLQFRILRQRQIPASALDELAEAGMNRIRQKKFFHEDPDGNGKMLFTAKTPAELQQLIKLFQVEEELIRKLLPLWRDAGQKVEIIAAINLQNLAKVTTNLPQRVGQILSRLGITQR